MNPKRRDILALGLGLMATSVTARTFASGRKRPLYVNALGGLTDDGVIAEMKTRGIDPTLLQHIRASGVAALNITLAAGPPGPHDFEDTLTEIADWDELIRLNKAYLLKVTSVADIEKARRSDRLGIIYGFQNTSRIGDSLERIDLFHDKGLRAIQLTYNTANSVGGGVLAPERGLTPWGRQVVERLNARRIMVDLSHSGTRTCLDAIAASRQPISINHTGCRAVTDLPRNKTDEELRGVAEKGGFVGIFMNSFLSMKKPSVTEDLIAHIEHAVNVCGEDHVGLGSDNDSQFTVHDSAVFAKRYDEVIAKRREQGISAPGEEMGFLPFLPDLQGPDLYPRLGRKLRARGYSQRVVDKILGENFVRYGRLIWGN